MSTHDMIHNDTLYMTAATSNTNQKEQCKRREIASNTIPNAKLLNRCKGTNEHTQSTHCPEFCKQTARHVHFDFVGNGTDPRTRHELATIAKELIEQRNNCCIQRLCSKRVCAFLFLYELLSSNVQRRLNMMQCKLINIKLKYYDIHQHSIIGHFSNLLRSEANFSSTKQLFKWLDLEYRRLFSVGQWHECIEVKYEFEDQHYMVHHVTLAIIQLYLTKLDTNSKRNLCRPLRTTSQTLDLQNVREFEMREDRGMLINDYIGAHIFGDRPWWIFFDVSLESGSITGDILKLAKSAYSGLKQENDTPLHTDQLRVEVGDHISAGGGLVKKIHHSKKSPLEIGASQLQRKVNAWIVRFEKSFSKIFKALQHYHDCKSAKNVSYLYQRTKELEFRNVSGDDGAEPHADLQYYFNRYKLAQLSLENLLRELEFCDYRNKLVPYLRGKARELNENTSKYNMTKFNACRAHLSVALKD